MRLNRYILHHLVVYYSNLCARVREYVKSLHDLFSIHSTSTPVAIFPFSIHPHLQVRLGQVIDSSVVSMSNGRDIIVVALKQHALGHLVVLPARRCFNDLIGGNAWALGQVNRVTIRKFVSRSVFHLNF